MSDSGSTAIPSIENDELVDIIVRRNGRTFTMLGPAGKARELSFLPDPDVFPGRPAAGLIPQQSYPVLIGSGTGAALASLVERLEALHGSDFLLAIVDKEADILKANGVRERFARYPGITWLPSMPCAVEDSDPTTEAKNKGKNNAFSANESSADATVKSLTTMQIAHNGLPFVPLLNPFYLRLNREFYSRINQVCEASRKSDFWERARYPRFASGTPRILMLTSTYFLMGEIVAACERLGIPGYLLQLPEGEVGQGEFIQSLLNAVLDFKPDFIFTINHLGVDREGVLSDLLEKLQLPMASWFVDNPHLILYLYSRLISPWTSIFTWDADNIASLKALGFNHVSYLPLGVDAVRFHPSESNSHPLRNTVPSPGPATNGLTLPPAWDGKVSFVGNSMVHKVLSRKERAFLPEPLVTGYHEVAAGFAESKERSVRAYLEQNHPDMLVPFDALPSAESRLNYETMLTWEATRQYRLSCIEGIMPFAPLIAGDTGWKALLGNSRPWHYRSELSYYSELPSFYPRAAINFNCTSKQMKGAVNQRIFDVPATESFLLTDYREQMENLFEPGREIICYHCPEEATALAEEYLKRPEDRRTIALAARKRILQEHTYEHRILTLIERMREIYG